ncbi:cytochrome c oxidase assembly factor Coa1 family protein [Chitiniphilus eburneus]|uniref:Uncharacterized protein n=1 Tax=Chitiniphilus eburneus TaxID=2571148 RepID=A0A4U0PWP2_9NEIS|nr:cytochrome c oxidase assembly factor Coa1 family protein [Chitiniphilus eburneus]TJZ72939.1 hypothetical protein FAZ21_12020 [Chitiniphilus eburneus]
MKGADIFATVQIALSAGDKTKRGTCCQEGGSKNAKKGESENSKGNGKSGSGVEKMKTKFKFLLIFIALLTIALYFIVYEVAVNSKASGSAVSFIRSSEFVRGRFGEIEDVKLNFSGYSIRTVGPKGNAELLYTVKGSKKTGEVNVELESHLSDEWNIVKVRVVGETWIPSERSPEAGSH